MFCVPLIASNTEDAIKKMESAAKVADILEMRLDLMDSFDVPGLVRASKRPVIITYRSRREGGRGEDAPDRVAGYLVSAIEAGAAFVDVELGLPRDMIWEIIGATGRSEIIVSSHITDRTPSLAELEVIYRDSIAAGGDIVKVVTMAQKWEDNLRTLELVNMAAKEKVRIISFCMGTLGRMSRVFSVPMGAFITFSSMDTGQESAEGQIHIKKMKELTEFFST